MPTVTYTTYEPAQLQSLDRNALITAWHESQAAMTQAVMQERQLRQLLFAKAFGEAPKVGINNLDLDDSGWRLQGTHNINWTVANNDAMYEAYKKLPDDVQDRLLKWKPELSITEWKKVQEDLPASAKAFAPFVTSKPGLPTLKLLAPGAEGNKR